MRKEFAVMAKGGKVEKSTARSKRLSAALRENLKRRKQQARARAETTTPIKDSSAKDATMESQGPDFRRNRGRE